MAGYSSRQAQQWNPESAFDIGNPDRCGTFTCVGWAPTQKRRCRNPIARHNQDAAREILNQLSRMDPLDVSRTQTGQLENVARYALCRRYHQDQVDRMVREWKRILREEVSWQPERWSGESFEESSTSRNHRRSVSHEDPATASPFASLSTLSSTRSRSGSQEPRQRNSRQNGMNERISRLIWDAEERQWTVASDRRTMREPRRQAPSTPAVVEEDTQHNDMNESIRRLVEDVEELRRTLESARRTMREPRRQAPYTPTLVNEEQPSPLARTTVSSDRRIMREPRRQAPSTPTLVEEEQQSPPARTTVSSSRRIIMREPRRQAPSTPMLVEEEQPLLLSRTTVSSDRRIMREPRRQAPSTPAVVEEEQPSPPARTTVSSGRRTMREPRRRAPSTPAVVEEEQQSRPARTLEPQQQSVAVPASEPAHRQTCTVAHISRRSVDEDCVICTMPMVNCSLSELVWCKSTCGRSVHRDCFEMMDGYVEVTRCVLWLVFLSLFVLQTCTVTIGTFLRL